MGKALLLKRGGQSNQKIAARQRHSVPKLFSTVLGRATHHFCRFFTTRYLVIREYFFIGFSKGIQTFDPPQKLANEVVKIFM